MFETDSTSFLEILAVFLFSYYVISPFLVLLYRQLHFYSFAILILATLCLFSLVIKITEG